MTLHREYTENTQGTDYFVGDIHGEYGQLKRVLERRSFDTRYDRLFSTGDFIDRGPDSPRCLEMLNEPWFFAVMGNHEEMLIQGLSDPIVRQMHLKHGGNWIESLSKAQLQQSAHLITEQTSVALTVNTSAGRIGVTHAAAPDNWRALQSRWRSKLIRRDLCLWSTHQYQQALTKNSTQIKNIDLVVHGHVNTPYIEKGVNQIWIDTLLQSGRLSILSAEELFSY